MADAINWKKPLQTRRGLPARYLGELEREDGRTKAVAVEGLHSIKGESVGTRYPHGGIYSNPAMNSDYDIINKPKSAKFHRVFFSMFHKNMVVSHDYSMSHEKELLSMRDHSVLYIGVLRVTDKDEKPEFIPLSEEDAAQVAAQQKSKGAK